MSASAVLLPLHDVISMTSLSKPTIYRAIRAKGFPAPVKISARRVAWKRDDIDAWLRAAPAAL